TLEEKNGRYCAVRLGFRQIDGFRWTDPDEARLKEIRLLSAECSLIESAEPRSGATSPYGRGVAPPMPQHDDADKEDWAGRIVAARKRRPFASLEDFARDTALPKRALILLADADAFRSIGLDRRAALWAVRRLPDDVPLPLFESAAAREQPDEEAQPL